MVYRFSFLLIFIYAITSNATAQICQGSLGDPIVNITFGAGANPGAPLSAATTNYQYVSTDCPKDGFYAVRNKTEKCFDSTWFTVTDHTGDANGYFMVVNASFDPGDFYLDTVRNLCSGSTYEFAAWLINIKRPVICWGATRIINPNITFRIEKTDGTILQTYNTDSIVATDPPAWKQYGFFFTTPAGVTDIVIRMVNNAPGGCGNDIGLDDITFRACGPQITATVNGSGSTIDTVCSGTAKNYSLQAQVSAGYNNPVYQWQQSINGAAWTNIPGETTTTYNVSFPSTIAPGNYLYRLVAAEAGNINSPTCRVASLPVTIYVAPQPAINATGNSPVCEGLSINLSSQGNFITWQGPNGFNASGNNVSIANAQTSYSGDYIATSSTGSCSWSDTTTVLVTTKPVVTVNTDSTTICEGRSVELSATGATNYHWAPANGLSDAGAASVTASPVSSVVYTVVGSNAPDCNDTATVQVKVLKKPLANAGVNRAIVEGTSVQLNGSVSGDSIRYYWTPDYNISSTSLLTASVTPLVDTIYILHAVSEAGCGSDEDSVRITIYKTVKVPNAFSPNNDGTNDRWTITGMDSYPGAYLTLFDRYGREVYRTTNYQPWDGTRNGQPLPAAVYYYVIDLRNGQPKITGHVYLAK